MYRNWCLSGLIQLGSSNVPASMALASGRHSSVKPIFVPHLGQKSSSSQRAVNYKVVKSFSNAGYLA